MNILRYLITLILLAPGGLMADMLYDESFSSIRFPINDDGLRFYGGWAGNSTSTSGTTAAAVNASQADLLPNSLYYIDSGGHALSTNGKHLWVDTDRETATISQVYALPTLWNSPSVGNTIWVSFVGKQTAGTTARFFNLVLRTSGTEIVAMGMPSGASDQKWRVWDRAGGANTAFAMSSTPTTTQSFVLVRMEANVDATDKERFTMWVNPRLDTMPQDIDGFQFTSNVSDVTSWADINEIRIGAGYTTGASAPSSGFEIDEIRIAPTWREVSPYLAMEITEIQYFEANGSASIAWTAAPGAEDTVEWSSDMVEWTPYPASTRVNPTGEVTATWTTPPTNRNKLFLRVTRRPPSS